MVPVSNATLGLMVTLDVLAGERSGREQFVIMPSYTFIATGQAAAWTGLIPIFVDIEPGSWHMSAGSLEAALDQYSDRTAAVLACSTYGTPPPPDLRDNWERLCGDWEVPLVVDSAAGFGATASDGRLLGLQGDAEVFSFHATKPFAIGEGGLITSRSAAFIDTVRERINFALDDTKRATNPFGLNAKMSELHAATALAVLDRFDAFVAERLARGLRLAAAAQRAGFEVQEGFARAPIQFLAVLAPSTDSLAATQRRARSLGVETRRYFESPLHTQIDWPGQIVIGDLPVTRSVASRILSLPMSTDMPSEHLERVEACFEQVD